MFSHRIKNEHHIVRYCKPRYYDCSKKEITSPDAFTLREGESYLSCFWKEYYKKDAIEKIYNEMITHRLTPEKTSGLSVLSVEKIKEIGNRHNLTDIEIKHLARIRSYSGVYKTTNEYKFLRDMLLIATENYNVADIHR